jgi:CRISPR-associated exonuclease Cas4
MWLHANGIRMEHTSDTVYDGKLLHETSYPQRAEKYTEFELSAITNDGLQLSGKIDFYDAKNKVIHEIKRSDKMESAHEWQVKYYIWLLEQNGVEAATGILEYPALRQTQTIKLEADEREYLSKSVKQIANIIADQNCPQLLNRKICKSCSYHDFCYATE